MFVRTEVSRLIPCPRERVFDISVDPERMPTLFRGFGPIPGMERVTVEGEHVTGALRTIHSVDGTALKERVIALERPRRHRYRVVSGVRPPLRWLVTGGTGDWTYEDTDDGTRVTWRFEWELTGAWALPMALPLMKLVFRTAQVRCLAELARQATRD